jgi:hypothetical protein
MADIDPNLAIALALEEIAASLKEIALSAIPKSTQPLGFQADAGRPEFIFANLVKGNGDGWYRLLENNQQETMPPAFWGLVKDLRFVQRERRGEDVTKLDLVMEGEDGKTYIFESGAQSFFSRSLLTALSLCPVADLQQPIRLFSYVSELQTGDKTLNVSITSQSGKLQASWKADDDWRAIATEAKTRVYKALGKEAPAPEPTTQPAAPPPTRNSPPAGNPPGGARDRIAQRANAKPVAAKVTDSRAATDWDEEIPF